MLFSSARQEHPAAAHPATRAAFASRAVFFTASALLYAAAILSASLTLNAYFSKTWDVTTFIHAARHLLDGGNPFDLYVQSRAAQTWPYAYPPLHAVVVAAALFLGDFVRVLPDYVWARVPALAADLGVGAVLYVIVLRKSGHELPARIAMLLWLFNPVTFYDTAVQGHFEGEWLLFVLLAYAWHEGARGVLLPTAALAVAVLFKQIAILFAIPLWIYIVVGSVGSMTPGSAQNAARLRKRLARVISSLALFALVTGAVCLPFLLRSDDFLYMNLTYVENVPVQTQSWIVALLGITRTSRAAFTSDFFLLRDPTIVTTLAAGAIACVAARRGWSLYLTATLIALAFFLTSKKVMGYYYVMLIPFLAAEALPLRRFALLLIAVIATTWISLSPYYAAWGNPDHWWIYALLGSLNSLLFVWLFAQVVSLGKGHPDKSIPHGGIREDKNFGAAIYPHPAPLPERERELPPRPFGERVGVRGEVSGQRNAAEPVLSQVEGSKGAFFGTPRAALFITFGLFVSAVFAALLQPLAQNSASPIRPPLVAPGMEPNTLVAFAGLLALSVSALAIVARVTRGLEGRLSRGAWASVLIFAPLFFSVYYLTKESTALLELALEALGV